MPEFPGIHKPSDPNSSTRSFTWMVAAPLPPAKLVKPNPSSVGSKKFSIGCAVDNPSVPSFAISPLAGVVGTMFEPPPDEPGGIGSAPLVSFLDWSSVIVSVERTSWSEDCPPPQARLQHNKETNKINLRTVEYIGARN